MQCLPCRRSCNALFVVFPLVTVRVPVDVLVGVLSRRLVGISPLMVGIVGIVVNPVLRPIVKVSVFVDALLRRLLLLRLLLLLLLVLLLLLLLLLLLRLLQRMVPLL